jgi:hypothetical protein
LIPAAAGAEGLTTSPPAATNNRPTGQEGTVTDTDVQAAPLTNKERKEDAVFLLESFRAAGRTAAAVLEPEEAASFASSDALIQQELFFKLLCYAVLSAQPAPEAVVRSDWDRLLTAGTVADVFAGTFELTCYALDPPVTRSDSKGKIIDFARLAATREAWAQLLPEPPDPDTAVDVLRATSGGALKSRAFWVVREMRRLNLWHGDQLDRYGYVPDGRVRKRAARMGLVDIPEKADSFADMKTVSRGLHAVMRLAGAGNGDYDLPITLAAERCELCDSARMASCPIPHCRWRREHAC